MDMCPLEGLSSYHRALAREARERESRERFGALLNACRQGRPDEASRQIQAGAPIQWVDDFGRQCVHWAACAGSLPCLELLANHGANLWALDAEGFSPWDLAREHGHEQCALDIERRHPRPPSPPARPKPGPKTILLGLARRAREKRVALNGSPLRRAGPPKLSSPRRA